MVGWLVYFAALCPPLALSAPDCYSGLAVLEPPSGLDVLRGGIDVEGAFAGLFELVGAFSAELLVLETG